MDVLRFLPLLFPPMHVAQEAFVSPLFKSREIISPFPATSFELGIFLLFLEKRWPFHPRHLVFLKFAFFPLASMIYYGVPTPADCFLHSSRDGGFPSYGQALFSPVEILSLTPAEWFFRGAGPSWTYPISLLFSFFLL